MVLDVKIDQVIAEKIKVKHQSVFFETPGTSTKQQQFKYNSKLKTFLNMNHFLICSPLPLFVASFLLISQL